MTLKEKLALKRILNTISYNFVKNVQVGNWDLDSYLKYKR